VGVTRPRRFFSLPRVAANPEAWKLGQNWQKLGTDAGRGAGLIGACHVAIRLVVPSRRNLGGASAR
jgi:hypothetical protein